MRYIFDLESDGLLDTVTRIHCLVLRDADTGQVWRFRSPDNNIREGVEMLSSATELIGHNILSYDLPALAKVFPGFQYTAKITDTLVCSRVIWTNLADIDWRNRRIPPKLKGRHSLESWGYRLGERKGDFGKTSDGELDEKVWAEWSPEMDEYCLQDVVVTAKFYELILSKNYAPTCLEIEHGFRWLIDQQERHGFRFNEEKAIALASSLQKDRLDLTESLQAIFPPTVETLKAPAYYYVEGSEERWPTKGAAPSKLRAFLVPGPLKTKLIPFNPGSRQQVVERLSKKYEWTPTEFTDSGQPKLDEKTLEGFDWPEAKALCDYFVIQKTLGMLADGDNGCLRLVKKGYIHGSVNTGGAVTGRCTHSKPNIAQTPSVAVRKIEGKKVALRGLAGRYGFDFRDLYEPDPGHVLVGWDASGLELRCLAHYLYAHDDGAFGTLVTDGDPHTANQNAAGLYLRDSAKTFIYAYL